MAYSTIKKGSSGGDVSTLQSLLNQNGYSLNVDGIFGSKTQSAVKDYQRNAGLTVDGIVGNNTWSALLGTGASTNPTASAYSALASGSASGSSNMVSGASSQLASYEANKPVYQQSQDVTDALNLLREYENSKPGAYESNYATQIQDVLDQIMNRKPFSYDFASDPLYQQYAQRYQQQGQLAMMDTMGQAAALTGGYGNSYAQTVGQQTYQGYLQALNDIIPELQNAAYQRYRDEGNQLLSNMDVLQGLENMDYGRYRDTVADYYNDLNYYYNRYNDMSEAEYNRYLNDLGAWERDRAYYYQKSQDAQAQANWQAEYDLALAKAQQAAMGSGSSSGGGGGGSRSSSKSTTKTTPTIPAETKAGTKFIQEHYGLGYNTDLINKDIDEWVKKGMITSQKEVDDIMYRLFYDNTPTVLK